MSSNNDSAHSRSLSEGRPSNPSIHKRSISDDHLSPIIVDDEDDHDHEAFIREEKASRIPKPRPIVKKIPSTNGTRKNKSMMIQQFSLLFRSSVDSDTSD